MGMGDDDDGEHTRVRWWIDAARYAVVALVTALTVATIARAVAVSLRSEKLYLRVTNVSASVMGLSPQQTVMLSLDFWAYNPSGRVGVRYNDVNVSLYHNGSEITWVRIDNEKIWAGPEIEREVHAMANLTVPSDVPSEFAQVMLMGAGEVTDATVRFNGTLQTQITGLKYTRGHTTQFRCPHVTILNVSRHDAPGDVSCNEVS